MNYYFVDVSLKDRTRYKIVGHIFQTHSLHAHSHLLRCPRKILSYHVVLTH